MVYWDFYVPVNVGIVNVVRVMLTLSLTVTAKNGSYKAKYHEKYDNNLKNIEYGKK